MNTELQNILQTISTKAKRLQERSMRLEKDNKEQQETIFKHLSTIAALQEQLKANQTLKSASHAALLSTADVVTLKKEIDTHIKVIDKAIALLQKDN
jgi:tetrahydrodipicolinate N-succinyltransferase